MKKTTTVKKRKLGSHSHEEAKRPSVLDQNFKQSKDIREDRGIVQSRLANNPSTALRPERQRK